MNIKPLTVVRVGLACVFLANGLTAFFMPQEFADLLGGSFVSGLLPFPIATAVLLIGVHDTLMALLILWGKYQKYIFGWACVWLVGVMIVVAEPLDVLEHLGFFAMALALWLSARD
jgi:uncharacterized membrane protein